MAEGLNPENFNNEQELSAEALEKQRREKIVAELLPIVKPLYSLEDSKHADYIQDQINEFANTMEEEQGYNLKEYYLWNLFSPTDTSEQNYAKFDIPNPSDLGGPGLIEDFIKNKLNQNVLEEAA